MGMYGRRKLDTYMSKPSWSRLLKESDMTVGTDEEGTGGGTGTCNRDPNVVVYCGGGGGGTGAQRPKSFP